MADMTTATAQEREHMLEDAAEVDADGFGPSAATSEVVLDVKDLQTHFATRWGTVKAVDGVNYSSAPRRDARCGRRVGIREICYRTLDHEVGAFAPGSHRRRRSDLERSQPLGPFRA